MASANKDKTFNGIGDVNAFIIKVELLATLKGYTGEKLAHAIASNLEGPAFDTYMRLSATEKRPC